MEVFMAELAEKVTAQLHSVETVMSLLHLGRSTVYKLLASGELRSVKVGSRRLVSESALIGFIERLDRPSGGDAA
jgi:excisionase family DNA binding protein